MDKFTAWDTGEVTFGGNHFDYVKSVENDEEYDEWVSSDKLACEYDGDVWVKYGDDVDKIENVNAEIETSRENWLLAAIETHFEHAPSDEQDAGDYINSERELSEELCELRDGGNQFANLSLDELIEEYADETEAELRVRHRENGTLF